jgi:hypothetical protein
MEMKASGSSESSSGRGWQTAIAPGMVCKHVEPLREGQKQSWLFESEVNCSIIPIGIISVFKWLMCNDRTQKNGYRDDTGPLTHSNIQDTTIVGGLLRN